jgi:hypothetical protein
MVYRFFGLILTVISASPRGLAIDLPICSEFAAPQACLALTPAQKLLKQQCQQQYVANGCAEIAQRHPEAGAHFKNCELIAACPMPRKLTDYGRACLKNMGGAWKDSALGLVEFVIGGKELPPELVEREQFFKACTSIECKRTMLGPYANLFSKEEIEGHPDRHDLDGRDPVNANYVYGYSAKVLYRQLLTKLRAQINNKTLDDPPLEPWSGRPAQAPSTMSEMIESALQRMGVMHLQCYDAITLTQLYCYGFFTVVDPLIVAGVAPKVAELAKLASAEAKVMAKTESAEERVALITARARQSFRGSSKDLSISRSEMQKRADLDTAELKKMNVQFIEKDQESMFDRYEEQGFRNYIEDAENQDARGHVYTIDEAPPAKIGSSTYDDALTHPEMAAYLKELKAMGFELQIDTSLPFMGVRGIANDTQKMIAISPHSTWSTFRHEFDHVKFFHLFGNIEYESVANSIRSGKSLKDVLPASARLSEKEVAQIENLIKRGLNRRAAEETRATDVQWQIAGFRRYLPQSEAIESRRLGLFHQIDELTKIKESGRTLTEAQTATLDSARDEYNFLDQYRTLPAKARALVKSTPVQATAVTTAAAAATVAGSLGLSKARPPPSKSLAEMLTDDDSKQFLYNDKGILVWTNRDGTFSSVQLPASSDSK